MLLINGLVALWVLDNDWSWVVNVDVDRWIGDFEERTCTEGKKTENFNDIVIIIFSTVV